MIVAVTVAGVGAGAAFGLYIGTRQLSAPIRRVSQVMSEVADGNLDVAVPYLGRKDEIGEMAAAVEVFKTNGREVRRMNAQESAMRAKSDDLQAGMAVVVDAAAAGISAAVSTRIMATTTSTVSQPRSTPCSSAWTMVSPRPAASSKVLRGAI